VESVAEEVLPSEAQMFSESLKQSVLEPEEEMLLENSKKGEKEDL
jgi:hypothetical protein